MHAGDERMVMTGMRLKRHARSMLGNLFLWFGERMGRKFDCFQPDIALEDGQDLAVYGYPAKIIHTPGHTPGSIAILTEDEQLFAGDTLANRNKPEGAWFIENEQELQASLVRLKKTNTRIIYPGHGRPFSGEALTSLT
jgi:glyoxylase-like metal-dependent hydrolase (beta-lactamase superfamily II)